MGTYVVTGAASGIGGALSARLANAGHTVIGIDLAGSTIAADLTTVEGRASAVAAVLDRTSVVDGVVPCAGMAGIPSRPGGPLVALNYFGAVAIVDGLHAALAAADAPAVVMIASNSVTMLASILDDEIIAACLDDDEEAAVAKGEAIGAVVAYPTSKAAICRWVRREAVAERWIGAGIRINAVAPGVTETAMIAETRGDPAVGDQVDLIPIPTGGAADPDQIAAAVEFLLGPGARNMCGSIVFTDGGTDAQLDPNRY